MACAGPAAAETIYAITGIEAGSALTSFDSATPGTLSLPVSLSGIVAGQSVRAIDFRPLTGALYALSHNNASNAAQIYTVDLTTGFASTVGAGFVFNADSTRISIDFMPVSDRIRVVADDGTNARVNPDTGALVGSDTVLAFDQDDPAIGPPRVVGIAYAPNYPGTTSTTLYAYDLANNVLATIGGVSGVPSPNAGLMFTIGSSGIIAAAGLGMDVADRSGIAYASAASSGGSEERLYRVNLATGALTQVGSFGSTRILDIAVRTSTMFRNGFE